MYLGFFLIFTAALVLTINAQFLQYPPQFGDNPLQQQQPFNPLPPHFNPFRGGGSYQLRQSSFPRLNPFDHVYNDKGEKLTCRMVCSPSKDTEEIDDDFRRGVAEKKDSGENKIEKKEE